MKKDSTSPEALKILAGAGLCAATIALVACGINELPALLGGDSSPPHPAPKPPAATATLASKRPAKTTEARPTHKASPKVTATAGSAAALSFPQLVAFAEEYRRDGPAAEPMYLGKKPSVPAEQHAVNAALKNPTDPAAAAEVCTPWAGKGVAASNPNFSGQIADLVIGVYDAGSSASEIRLPNGGEVSQIVAWKNIINLCGTVVEGAA